MYASDYILPPPSPVIILEALSSNCENVIDAALTLPEVSQTYDQELVVFGGGKDEIQERNKLICEVVYEGLGCVVFLKKVCH